MSTAVSRETGDRENGEEKGTRIIAGSGGTEPSFSDLTPQRKDGDFRSSSSSCSRSRQAESMTTLSQKASPERTPSGARIVSAFDDGVRIQRQDGWRLLADSSFQLA
jgi:hypothetical protein